MLILLTLTTSRMMPAAWRCVFDAALRQGAGFTAHGSKNASIPTISNPTATPVDLIARQASPSRPDISLFPHASLHMSSILPGVQPVSFSYVNPTSLQYHPFRKSNRLHHHALRCAFIHSLCSPLEHRIYVQSKQAAYIVARRISQR